MELDAGKKRQFVSDSGCLGLSIQISAVSKTFYLYKKIRGKPIKMRIGAFPEWSVTAARHKCNELLREFADGRDPREKASPITLGEAYQKWRETHAIRTKAQASLDEDAGLYERHLLPWDRRKLAGLKRSDVSAWHTRIGKDKGHYAANRGLSLLKTVVRWAISSELFDGPDPTTGIVRFPEPSRERYLLPEEAPAFFAALEAEKNQNVANLFRLLLFAGQRMQATRTATWDQISLQSRLWLIPRTSTKNKRPHVVSLNDEALAVLGDQKERYPESRWVFPSRNTSGEYIGYPQAAWARLRKRSGLVDFRPHDLRRTLGSWMAIGGASLGVIGKQLGHQNQNSTAIYARLSIDAVAEAAQETTRKLISYDKSE